MKIFRPGFSWFVMLVLVVSASAACGQSTKEDVKDIDVEKFDKLRTKPNYVVLDVRTPEECAEGKVEGAIEIDFFGEDRDSTLKTLDPGKKYLVYCRSGRRSTKTAVLMHEMGFEHVRNLEGGYIEWSKTHEK